MKPTLVPCRIRFMRVIRQARRARRKASNHDALTPRASVAYAGATVPAIFTKGDIFATPDLRAYAHGCNCAGTMDSGIAVAFKKRWPGMFDEYSPRCADGR